MVHTEVTQAWVYEHFLIYLYLSIADADCLISNEELDEIRKRAFKGLDEDRCSKLVREVFREYRSHTEDERKDYIRENVSKYLRTDSIRKKVISELQSVVPPSADEGLELLMFRYIRKIINTAK